MKPRHKRENVYIESVIALQNVKLFHLAQDKAQWIVFCKVISFRVP